ncbi:unnamed protein product [Brassica oleracea]
MKWFLCVAIERLKQEASSVQGVELKTDNKKNWMSSAQLWISNSNSQSQSTNEEENRCVTQTCNNNNANQRGAIMSFNRPPPPPPSAPLSLPKSEILTDYSSRIEQMATPKQIRDIMKVDGLTNDEVKSHLQVKKYRMYIRKHTLHPTKNFSASDQPRETQNLISLSRSDSPQGPLDW